MMKRFSHLLSWLQKLGQSLMIPVSVLPAAGLVVALGRGLQQAPSDSLWFQAGQILYSAGLAVFEQLPLVFAVGVAIGFTSGAGVAGLAAVVGYFTLTNLLKVFGQLQGLQLAINTGVFGGIAVGLLAAWVYNRFSQVRLHPVLGFFSGKRLVPIVMVAATLVLSFAFGLVWPGLQLQINDFGQWVTQSSAGAAFYAAGKRLLIPVGLHHVYYPPFLYQFGEFLTAAGQVVHGDSARYFAGDPNAGLFMASEFPLMLFGLPAAAAAIVLRARPEKRRAIAGVMLTAALTSIITGITEPIEFAFIFVAPILFVVHVCLAFVSGLLTQAFDIHLGYTFSASFIDFILGYFNQKNAMYLWLLVGPLMALVYFTGFYTLIGWLDLKTPGREIEETAKADTETSVASLPPTDDSILGEKVLAALGGASNIQSLDACITRLRVVVKEASLVKTAQFKELGAAGSFHDGHQNFQIIFGTKSDHLKEIIAELMKKPTQESYQLLSPLKGRVVPLDQVPDATFSQKILGQGVAIEPEEGVIYAPFDGTAVQVFKTGHALGLSGPRGLELLIHVGIDSVKLNGEGFKPLIKTGDHFKRGDRLLEFDLQKLKALAPSILTPVVITNSDEMKQIRPRLEGQVGTKDRVAEIDFQGASL